MTTEENVRRCTLFADGRRDAPAPPPDVETLPDLFAWQAGRRQDATLFSFHHDDEDQQRNDKVTSLSYNETFRQVVALSHPLHRTLQRNSHSYTGTFDNVLDNFQRNDITDEAPVVGVWFEKSIDLHLALLATTFAGAAWLPFDPDAPVERVTACLRDSKASVLLCDEAHRSRAKQAISHDGDRRTATTVITIDQLRQQQPPHNIDDAPLTRPCRSNGQHTAYMIYTSGSTGTPKGIAIPHRAALTFALSEQTVLRTNESDVVWQGFSPAFDMFIEEVWVSIAGGAHLTVGSRAQCRDVPTLGGAHGVWAQRGVTVVNAVPTLINIMTSLDDAGLPKCVRLLNLGGEACPPALVKRLWHKHLRILNTYGPSETTVTATFQELRPEEQVTIGKPLPSYHALLLPIADDGNATANTGPRAPNGPLVLDPGVEGELAIGGACLGIGYVGRAELTAEKFIAHPFAQVGLGERLYRTGDRVRLDESLNIVFIGRIDTQVKHRGFRIELGEIECALSSHACVQTAAVILSDAKQRLEAYVVVSTTDSTSVDATELRGMLGALPAYMLPEVIYFLEASEMPRLPSGKINAKALQSISAQRAELEQQQQQDATSSTCADVDPHSTMGILLAALQAVLPHAGVIRPDSDFFDDLGGHSLAAAMLVSRLRKDCPSHSPLRTLGLQTIYTERTAERIVAKYDQCSTSSVTSAETSSEDDIGVSTGKAWNVTQTRFVLCGLAQIPALLFIWFLQAVQLMVPYVIFVYVLDLAPANNGVGGWDGVGWALLATYGVFVVTPIFFMVVAIIGKWIIIGRVRAGEYPLYGVYYYRWWLMNRLVGLMDLSLMADTPLLSSFWRLMGAKVGAHCHIGHVSVAGSAFDLVDIGDDVVLANTVNITVAYAERGRLILKPVSIGSGVYVGANSVLEGGCIVEHDAEVMRMTMVPDGIRIPAAQRWYGSPARYIDAAPNVGLERATRPSILSSTLTGLAVSLLSVFALPVVWFAPQIPTMLLLESLRVPHIGRQWAQTGVFAVPAALAYILLVFSEVVALRWLILGRVRERKYSTSSVYFVRKWFVDRMMALSLTILHPVYATLYVVPYLRALGVGVGARAEVSTAAGLNFNLTQIGEESFVADNVHVGPDEVRGHSITLRTTTLEKRAFAGNGAVIPQGATLRSDTLVGVLSVAPDPTSGVEMISGQSCFGSPPVMMPARQAPKLAHPAHLLYAPHASQIATRLFIEGARIVVPRAMIVFGLGFGVSIFQLAYTNIGAVYATLMLPLFNFTLFAIPALLITLAFKWTMIGRYHATEWPLWSVEVWRSEFVTSTYETLLAPLLTNTLIGTPFLAMCFRLFGVTIGARVTLLHNDITEYDMVTLGDESILNVNAGGQTHLFEDRVMKIGPVTLGKRAVIKTHSVCLPNSSIMDDGMVGCLSLVMKGETVPHGEAWEGAPIAPRQARRRAPLVKMQRRATICDKEADAEAPSSMPSEKNSFVLFVESQNSSVDDQMSPRRNHSGATTANASLVSLSGAKTIADDNGTLDRPRGDGSRASSTATFCSSNGPSIRKKDSFAE